MGNVPITAMTAVQTAQPTTAVKPTAAQAAEGNDTVAIRRDAVAKSGEKTGKSLSALTLGVGAGIALATTVAVVVATRGKASAAAARGLAATSEEVAGVASKLSKGTKAAVAGSKGAAPMASFLPQGKFVCKQSFDVHSKYTIDNYRFGKIIARYRDPVEGVKSFEHQQYNIGGLWTRHEVRLYGDNPRGLEYTMRQVAAYFNNF